MKYLVVGLGNIGDEYAGTRHNIGFRVLDALAGASNAVFEDKRYGFVAHTRVKNAELVLLKPSTYMNLSGMAVRYWLNKENVDLERLLVVVDDLALPFGKLRLKGNGSDGGHNGLKNIAQLLCTQNYARHTGRLRTQRFLRRGTADHGRKGSDGLRGCQGFLPLGVGLCHEPL